MTADNSRAAAIARAVLAQAEYAEPKPFTSLGYGAQQVIAGQAAAQDKDVDTYYAEMVAEARAEHDRAVAESAASDDAAALVAKIRGNR
ncbi:hypothetical protein [Curtobacterium sp. MCLR17_054]|uniref:hypothetical protein n=1 Tax=Curtobacterium sp. MCLR17_054 TaxID=2175632 RepID=UPI000DAA80C2|nr:hypothetical protein [Curtobacterium sp. MCLR17_054]WIE67092.1 hypothetical protein DEJ08_011190 [Curtobacterium sp. MCLR17_054]